MKPAWLFIRFVAALAALALLPSRETAPSSEGMKTLAKPAAKKPARKLSMSPAAVRARRYRAEEKADYEKALKVCARLDAGTERVYSSKVVERELGL